MRKLLIPVFACVLLLVLTACSGPSPSSRPAGAAGSRAASSAGSGPEWNKVASDVAFREGTAGDGRVVLSSADIAGFYTQYTKFNHSYEIAFQLTDSGKKAFAQETKKLLGNTVSVWAGKELIQSASVEAPITDGSVAITVKDEDTMKNLCEKLESRPE